MRIRKVSLSLALTFGFVLSSAASISALPLYPAGGDALAAPLQATSPLIEVRNRRGATEAGFAAGVITGNIVASQPRYYSGYPQFYTPAYPASGPYSAGDPAIAYCTRRFRTYDPYTMTYRGYDGYRYSCP
jgi:BA14K-like protein